MFGLDLAILKLMFIYVCERTERDSSVSLLVFKYCVEKIKMTQNFLTLIGSFSTEKYAGMIVKHTKKWCILMLL